MDEFWKWIKNRDFSMDFMEFCTIGTKQMLIYYLIQYIAVELKKDNFTWMFTGNETEDYQQIVNLIEGWKK